MIRFTVAAIVLNTLLLAACQQTLPHTQTVADTTVVHQTASHTDTLPGANLIVPGQRIGGTSINENMDSVVQRLGKPDAGDAAMGKALSIWYAGHNSKGYQTAIFSSRQMGADDESSRVKYIRITSPRFRLQNGLRVGSSLNKIKKHYVLSQEAVYSEADVQYNIYTATEGVAFEIASNGICKGIIVQAPGQVQGSIYVPFHNNLEQY